MKPVIYLFISLYLIVPMLDSTVCADCLGNAPFQGEATLWHLQAPHGDVGYSSPEHAEANTCGSAPDAKPMCSICANVLMGVAVVSPHPPLAIAQSYGPQSINLRSEIHYSINKPPQNRLG